MHERARPNTAWYRRKILESIGHEEGAGPVPSDLPEASAEMQEHSAFGTFIRLERRARRLSVAEFAAKLRIDEEELRHIERDPIYSARPRTIVCISQYLKVPSPALIKLSGAARSVNPSFKATVLKFAAHSDDIVGLNDEERALLREFVQFLKNT